MVTVDDDVAPVQICMGWWGISKDQIFKKWTRSHPCSHYWNTFAFRGHPFM